MGHASRVRVLVVFASKHGATREIAEAIGTELSARGLDTDVSSMDAVVDLEGYGAVVLGSAVYVGRWLEPARRFVEAHLEALSALPLWLFSSGPLGDPLKPDDEHAVAIDEIVASTLARDHHLFGGKLDRSGLGLGERAIVHAVRAADGDYRQWDEIAAWARAIARQLREADTTSS